MHLRLKRPKVTDTPAVLIVFDPNSESDEADNRPIHTSVLMSGSNDELTYPADLRMELHQIGFDGVMLENLEEERTISVLWFASRSPEKGPKTKLANGYEVDMVELNNEKPLATISLEPGAGETLVQCYENQRLALVYA